jgi:hypothetical protein
VSANAIVWWASLLAVIVVLALAGAQLARALRELNRAKARVAGYGELPIFKSLERAETDAQRLTGAIEQIEPLIARAHAAVAVIKRGPIPPELIAAAKRVAAEITALRNVTR